jgi:hypothetical protein
MLWFLKQTPDREGSTVGELKKKLVQVSTTNLN